MPKPIHLNSREAVAYAEGRLSVLVRLVTNRIYTSTADGKLYMYGDVNRIKGGYGQEWWDEMCPWKPVGRAVRAA